MDDPAAWIPLIIWTLLFAAPLVKLLDRTGLSMGWIVIALIPIGGGLVMLYLVAFAKWPAVREASSDV
ncbi:MAG: hypothetical protein HY060_21035 [Proteobacteria bacterium]|nr:hypothetical protein [Pseudomonadota bacterium]